MEIVKALNSVFWGWLVAGVLLSCGVYLTIRLADSPNSLFHEIIIELEECEFV